MTELPGIGGVHLRVAAWIVGVFALALLGLPLLDGGFDAMPKGAALVVLPSVGITAVAFACLRPKVRVPAGASPEEVGRALTADLTRRVAVALGVAGLLMTLAFGALAALFVYAISTWDTSK